MTEIMYAIGAKNSLTAVSNYCTYPEDAKKKEKIGSNYSINYEKIIKLKPDYLLALDISEGLVSKVRRFGITPLCFKYPNIESIYQNILEVGKLTGKIKESREVVEFSKQKITAANIRNKKNAGKKILYLVQVQPMIAIGNKSFITDIIEKSGNYSPISLSKQKWHGAVPSVAPKTGYLSSAIGPARNEYFSIWDMAETESLSA